MNLMGFKVFCDDCKKEIKRDQAYYCLEKRVKNFNSSYYCQTCFSKHWIAFSKPVVK